MIEFAPEILNIWKMKNMKKWNVLAMRWTCIGDDLGMIWACFGDDLGVIWACFGDDLGMNWE